MPQDTFANNKRIAKNTLVLYVRMLFLMLISLYTSRVILETLGVDDFGIYNVVGGIVVMSSFFKNTMAGATQRFLSYCLGKENHKEMHDTFETAMFLHVIICILTLVLAESVGLWFLNTQLNIPIERNFASNIVYQLSILTFIFSTISAPYDAIIIARENMNVFAYLSLFEAFMKLLIAYLISTDKVDRLILYGILLFINSFLLRMIYAIYCKRNYPEATFGFKYNLSILKKMTGYMGWSLYANVAGTFYGQGVNMLLNMFFGPAVNAARGLAFQVQHAIQNFTSNFQVAVNPQIVKYYAMSRLDDMYILMKRSSRFSFYIMLIICTPVILTADVILDIWLTTVPQYAILFCQLALIISLIDTVSNPLTTATKATGKLKLNALLGGTNLLLIIPISYIFLKMDYGPAVVFYVNIVIALIGMCIRLFINRRLIKFPVIDFLIDVFIRGWFIAIIAGITPYILNSMMVREFSTIIIITVVSLITNATAILLLGITKGERIFLFSKLKLAIGKFK